MRNKNMAFIRKSDKVIHFATLLVTAGGLLLKPGSCAMSINCHIQLSLKVSDTFQTICKIFFLN